MYTRTVGSRMMVEDWSDNKIHWNGLGTHETDGEHKDCGHQRQLEAEGHLHEGRWGPTGRSTGMWWSEGLEMWNWEHSPQHLNLP